MTAALRANRKYLNEIDDVHLHRKKRSARDVVAVRKIKGMKPWAFLRQGDQRKIGNLSATGQVEYLPRDHIECSSMAIASTKSGSYVQFFAIFGDFQHGHISESRTSR